MAVDGTWRRAWLAGAVIVLSAAGAAAGPRSEVELAMGGGGGGGMGGAWIVTPGAPAHVTIALGRPACLCDLPVVLAQRLGAYKDAALEVEFVPAKDVAAAGDGDADVASGDYGAGLAARHGAVEAFVVYDRLPGLVLAVSPRAAQSIKSIGDLSGKTVGISAPGSGGDFFLRNLLATAGVDPEAVPAIGSGPGAAAALEEGRVDAAVLGEPAATLLATRDQDLRLLADARSERGAAAALGEAYPSGALYASSGWVAGHAPQAQALADAVIAALAWIKGHSADEIMARMPDDAVGPDRALYLAALESTLPTYSRTGLMDPKGAAAVLDMLGRALPELAAARIDPAQTYTNDFAARADARLGIAP
jgi:NitT/TauT family transport system substrate-binding protein